MSVVKVYEVLSLLLSPLVFLVLRGWSGGAMVLGKLPVPVRPTYLELSRASAYCACSGCGRGCLDIFSLVYHFSFLSPSLWETARHRLKYCLKGPLSPKQPINQFFGFEGEVWDLIVSIPDHCLSLYFEILMENR